MNLNPPGLAKKPSTRSGNLNRVCSGPASLPAYGRGMLGRLVAILTFSRRTVSLTDPAKVIDGDTIVVAEQLVRLHGIDAPELDQPFWWQGQKLMGGALALAALEVLTAGVAVRCKAVERDRHGRIVAKVFAPDRVDISHRLVSAGWALAYGRHSTDYMDAEDKARGAKRGLWRGSFVKPWLWRASQGTQAPARVVPMSGPRQ